MAKQARVKRTVSRETPKDAECPRCTQSIPAQTAFYWACINGKIKFKLCDECLAGFEETVVYFHDWWEHGGLEVDPEIVVPLALFELDAEDILP